MSIKVEVEKICNENGVELTDSVDEIDSLQYISIMVGIEEKFKIIFPDEVLETNMLDSIDDLCNIIERQLTVD